MVKRFKSKIGLQRISSNTRASQADFTRSTRAAMSQIEDNLSRFIDHIKNVSSDILLEAFRPTFEKSQLYTPKDTGALVESGYLDVRQSARGAVLEIGYGKGGQPHYAAFVHERTDIPHAAPTRAKFLQSAIEEDADDIQQRIIEGYKRASGVV